MERISAMERVAPKVATKICGLDYYLNGQVQSLTKIKAEEFSVAHWRTLESAYFNSDGHLMFDNTLWQSAWLGAGEEKAVYLVVDEKLRAFALELLDRQTYLEGKLAEGIYFGDVNLTHIAGYKPNPGSLVGHVFGGRGRVREYIYGETLAGPLIQPRHQGDYRLPFPFAMLTWLSRKVSRFMVSSRYKYFCGFYCDAHEANVMVELLPLHNPEGKSHYFLPLLWSDHSGQPHWRYFRLTPIDVRNTGRKKGLQLDI